MRRRNKEANPYRIFKYDQDLRDTYYYECKQYQPVGRVITALVKQLKTMDISKVRGVYVLSPENLVFSGNERTKLEKYYQFYQAGSWTKGPYIQRTPKGLFKYLFRRNLLWKTRDKHVYKKLCVLDMQSSKKFDKSRSTKMKTKVLPKLYCKNVSMTKLFKRI